MVMVFVPAAPKGVKVMAVGTELPLVKAKVPELVPVLAAVPVTVQPWETELGLARECLRG
jgi:hypothetical protein